MQLNTPEGVFESGCDMIEATSSKRPDTAWVFTDAHGHQHRWFLGDQPATNYRPTGKYHVPSLTWIHDGYGVWEDGEQYEIGHHECRECGEHIEPQYRADDTQQWVPGLRWYRINGRNVSEQEFKAAFPSG